MYLPKVKNCGSRLGSKIAVLSMHATQESYHISFQNHIVHTVVQLQYDVRLY